MVGKAEHSSVRMLETARIHAPSIIMWMKAAVFQYWRLDIAMGCHLHGFIYAKLSVRNARTPLEWTTHANIFPSDLLPFHSNLRSSKRGHSQSRHLPLPRRIETPKSTEWQAKRSTAREQSSGLIATALYHPSAPANGAAPRSDCFALT